MSSEKFPYFIGMGTGIIKEFLTLEEMFEFHKKMPPMDRHFCKLYDSVKHRRVPGWSIQWDYSDDSRWYQEEAGA